MKHDYVEALNLDMQFHVVNCGECGGVYAMNQRYVKQKSDKGGYWTCPYCKCSWGYGESEIQRLDKQLKQAQKQKEWAEQSIKIERELRHKAELRERGQKAAKTRIKNRIANGVCPCCNRSFQNLHQHMKKQHPDYADSQA